MDPDREAFLAGERVDDVHIYLGDDAVSDPEPLEQYGERVEDGVVLVLDGERARGVFRSATGIDPMAFAKEAMDTDGDVAPDCTGGTCPAADGGDHRARFVFAFAEAQNEAVGGLYADGPVVHAYAACTCGARYADKWLTTEQ